MVKLIDDHDTVVSGGVLLLPPSRSLRCPCPPTARPVLPILHLKVGLSYGDDRGFFLFIYIHARVCARIITYPFRVYLYDIVRKKKTLLQCGGVFRRILSEKQCRRPFPFQHLSYDNTHTHKTFFNVIVHSLVNSIVCTCGYLNV